MAVLTFYHDRNDYVVLGDIFETVMNQMNYFFRLVYFIN